MCFFKLLLLSIQLGSVNGINIGFNNLIEKVYIESNSATLAFVGFDEEFLGKFMRINSNKPILNFQTSTNLDETINRNTILIVKEEKDTNSLFALFHRVIQKLKVRKCVIVLTENSESLQNHFEFFWEQKFKRIFGFCKNISYAYLNYADDPMQQISLRKDRPLPNAMTNLNGFPVRTTVQKDIPRSFWYHDKKGRRKIGGYSGQIFANFIIKHNATYEEVILENSDKLILGAVIYASKNGDVDISTNIFSPVPECDLSYPLKFNVYCVMVPWNRNVNSHQYFIRPFSPMLWLCLLITSIYISLMDYLKDFYSSYEADLWQSFSETFMRVGNMPTRIPTTAYRFHSQVLIFSFIFGNYYLDYFTSFLTAFIKVKQYETFKDLYDNNISLMLPYYEVNYLQIIHPELRDDTYFHKILYPVDYLSYIENLNSMRNTKHAYTVSRDRGQFLIRLQAFFEEPLFRTVQISSEYFQNFVLEPHSHFKEILNDFIVRSFETGLIMKWEIDTIAQAISVGFQSELRQKVIKPILHVPLTMKHLSFALIFLICGWFLGGIVLVCETIPKIGWAVLKEKLNNLKPSYKINNSKN
ncbi:uncharacterized protein LOC129950782 [Eupeodes corollae]|uniref:uncharacterized protein LOC129950782 n=1 Tax=Eupeodes corollae TaxID=290404 RepID=UPI00248FB64F|nr:uncharacterized protein LOC129950782 [Eupeodes corollae]